MSILLNNRILGINNMQLRSIWSRGIRGIEHCSAGSASLIPFLDDHTVIGINLIYPILNNSGNG